MVIDDVVNGLDLSCLYIKVPEEGNVSYHPKMMLKVLFYSYASNIFSSRNIAKALGENISLIYLAAWQRPDFRTINNFRRNNLEELKDLFAQIVLLCWQLNMVKLGHISIDGSKFKANAASRQSYDKQRIEKEMKAILEKAAEKDKEEDALYGADKSGDELPQEVRDRRKRIEKLKELQQQMEQKDREKINATDPDAVFMKSQNGFKPSYNAQVSADETSQIVVAAEVVNTSNDRERLCPMIDQTEENTQQSVSTLSADAGYSSAENLKELESEDYNHIDAYIPDSTYQVISNGREPGPFHKSRFVYDEDNDHFICPAGHILPFASERKNKGKTYREYRCKSCRDCPHFSECTTNKRGRTISQVDGFKRIKAMREKLDTDAGKAIYGKRRHIVEPVFGHIKSVIGFTDFHLRGLDKVNGEFKLVAIAHNLKKIAKWGYQRGVGLTPMPIKV
jgi:transposase